ncbi:site-specific DNA-methyltransferase [Rhodococcus sovatensis]|jgi:site-specific DNA-methyltransferase (adenine-specific)|uniref:Methyltransferase n=1 Tax=Rhodococcus sovatensis TaxID=1805840 RepID=A0ABZ2PMT6_9NOCA
MKTNTIIVGDVRDVLNQLADASVDCIVTSPPYIGLRDYGHPDQLGAEQSVDDWVKNLRIVAQGLQRVLTPSGSLWLNIGDSYAAHPKEGAARKSLLLGPQRLALALADDGWLVRNVVVWAKPNPMPSSVTDRLSTTYETILLLVRSPTYYFDLDAIRVAPVDKRMRAHRKSTVGYPPVSAVPIGGGVDRNLGLDAMKRRGVSAHPLGKSPGDVWTIPTAGYKGAHFATYPLALAERAILAGCPERVCVACGSPWRRTQQPVNGRMLRVGALQPSCTCSSWRWRPGIVLDPFMGSGTTALAAQKHRRDWVGIELNADYAEQARTRIAQHNNITE